MQLLEHQLSFGVFGKNNQNLNGKIIKHKIEFQQLKISFLFSIQKIYILLLIVRLLVINSFLLSKEIMKTIKETDKEGNRQSGVIWHTQGSGKSLTMVMLAKYLLSDLAKEHPQLVVVTDRIELDSQIHKTFNHSRLKAARATSGKNLVSLIENKKAMSLQHLYINLIQHLKIKTQSKIRMSLS